MMCDLSLATGQPLSALRRWPDRDVQALALHTARHGWPLQRIELTLARLGRVVAKLAGVNISLDDILLSTEPTDGTESAVAKAESATPDDGFADLLASTTVVSRNAVAKPAPTQH